jgi:hypothetical protein
MLNIIIAFKEYIYILKKKKKKKENKKGCTAKFSKHWRSCHQSIVVKNKINYLLLLKPVIKLMKTYF